MIVQNNKVGVEEQLVQPVAKSATESAAVAVAAASPKSKRKAQDKEEREEVDSLAAPSEDNNTHLRLDTVVNVRSDVSGAKKQVQAEDVRQAFETEEIDTDEESVEEVEGRDDVAMSEEDDAAIHDKRESESAPSEAASEDSEQPAGEAMVTTRCSDSIESDRQESIDSDQPESDPMITTKSTSMSASSIETEKVANDKSSSAKNGQKKMSKGYFTCGARLCVDSYGVDDEVLTGEVVKKPVESIEEVEDDVPTEGKAENKPAESIEEEEEITEEEETEEEETEEEEEKEVAEEEAKVESNVPSVEEKPQEEETAKETVQVEEESSVVDETTATGEVDNRPTQPAAVETVQPVAISPVNSPAIDTSTSFEVQQRTSCATVLTCGILGARPVSPKKSPHIPMTFSQDLIMFAREEGERELEERTGTELPSTPEDDKPEATEEQDQQTQKDASDEGAAVEEEQEPVKEDAQTEEAAAAEQQKAEPTEEELEEEQMETIDMTEDKTEPDTKPSDTVPAQVESEEESSSGEEEEAAPGSPKSMREMVDVDGVVVDDFDTAARLAQQEAYACGCTIL